MTTDTLLSYITAYLRRYAFDHYWHEPDKHFRKNIRLTNIGKTVHCGSARLLTKILKLPLNTACYVYNLPIAWTDPFEFHLDIGKWTKLVNVMNKSHFDIRLGTLDGMNVYRGDVYITRLDERTLVLCVPATAPGSKNELYMSQMYHEDVSSWNVYCTEITSSNTYSLWNYLTNQDPTSMTIYLDGRLAPLDLTQDQLKFYKYIEIITDESVTAVTYFPFKDFKTAYMDSVTSKLFYTFHIPKNLNPQNRMILHDHCDLYAVHPTLPGYVINRWDTQDDVKQLTHNDFAISEDVLNRANVPKDFFDDWMIMVQIRFSNQDPLMRNAEYTNYLYMLTDDKIAAEIASTGTYEMPWSGETLSKSQQALISRNVNNMSTLKNLVNLYGYYHTVDLLCHRYHSADMTSWRVDKPWDIPVPVVLATNNQLKPLVWINKYLIDETDYTVKRNGMYLTIALKPDVYEKLTRWTLKPNDSETVDLPGISYPDPRDHSEETEEWYNDPYNNDSFKAEIVDTEIFDGTPRTKYFDAVWTMSNDPIVTPVKCDVYQVSKVDVHPCTQNKLTPINITTEQLCYRRLSGESYILETQLADGQWKYEINTELSEEHILVVSQSCFSRQVMDMTLDASNYKPLITPFLYDGDFPVLDPSRILVFLNHKELIPNLDYVVYQQFTNDGWYIGSSVIVTNVSYLNDTNQLEVLTYNETQIGDVRGFMIENEINVHLCVLNAFTHLGGLIADGAPCDSVPIESYTKIMELNNVKNGAPYRLRALAPKELDVVMSPFETNKQIDDARISYIVSTFENPESEEKLSLIEASHCIYSVAMQLIVSDVVNRTLNLSNANTDEQLIAVAKPYITTYRAWDPVFRSNVDRNFVDVLMSYRIYDVIDTATMQKLERIYTLLIDDDDIRDGELPT